MFLKYFSNDLLKWPAFVAILLLSGCMDIEQEIWIAGNASAVMEYRVGLHENHIEVAKRNDPERVCDDVQQDKAVLESLEGVDSVKQSTRHEAGIYYCETRVEVEHYSQLTAVHEKIMSSKAGQQQSLAERYLAEFTLKQDKDGKGYFRQHVMNKAGDEKNKSRLDIQFRGLADLFMGQAMAGRYWTVILHAPDLSNTSGGSLDSKQEKVTWRVPLYDLMSDINYAFDMQASFEAEPAWYQKLWKWVS